MTTWNYRLVRTELIGGTDYYEVHEVFYNKAGKPTMMTQAPVTFGGETPQEVIKAMEMALKDVRERGLFVPPLKWAKP